MNGFLFLVSLNKGLWGTIQKRFKVSEDLTRNSTTFLSQMNDIILFQLEEE